MSADGAEEYSGAFSDGLHDGTGTLHTKGLLTYQGAAPSVLVLKNKQTYKRLWED